MSSLWIFVIPGTRPQLPLSHPHLDFIVCLRFEILDTKRHCDLYYLQTAYVPLLLITSFQFIYPLEIKHVSFI